MYPCSRGEVLTRTVQENAANRTVAITTCAQVCERPELFIGIGACGNSWVCASNFPTGCGFHTVQKRCEDASHSKALRAKCIGHAESLFAKALGVRTRCRVAFIADFRIRWPVRLSFGTQHHDWPGTLSPLLVRGLFLPIWRSRSMDPDLTARGSNEDAQNAANTRESSRVQTVVLSL